MKRILTLFLAFVACPVLAQDWALRVGDRVMSRTEVEELTTGNTLVFHDGGQSRYSAGGSYSYTYASGQSAYGQYEIAEDGTVCIRYRNGFGRCDRYVRSGERIVLLTVKGLRFPVRPPEP